MLTLNKQEQTNLAEAVQTLEKLRAVINKDSGESNKMYVYDKDGNKVIL